MAETPPNNNFIRLGPQGFTLVEILIVMLIMVLAIAVVYPVSYKMVDRFDLYLEKFSGRNLEKKERFLAFIQDEKYPSEN